ncbi:hypothetical protein AcV5_006808 [Taiwanofungus camphoratus]|nr:hypothetical protein AcV5_006808 [Antrodia cinnamomea]
MAFAFLSSARLLQWLCIVLHFTLVALHISLLIVLARRAEHTVVVSLAKSGMASTILVVVLQVFITGYSVVLLVSTQRLALKRVLLKRQTLTAAHDVSSAWTGLGAALVSLWRQTSISASLFGTSLVAMYLAGTAVLHITTLSLFVIEAFNNTNAVIIPSTIGRHNITLNSSVSDTSYAFFFWESTSELLPYVGHASPQATLGLYNSTLFDVLENNNSLGNVSVGASAANISCGFLSNGTAVNTNATDPSSVWFLRADYDGYEIGFDVPPIDAGVIKVVPQNLLLLQTKYLGRNVIFYLTANISDSEGNLGGLIPLDPPLKPVYAGEGYAVGTVRVVGCTLSWMPQNATVDAQTRNLVSANPSGLRTSSTWNIWTPTLQNSSLLVPYVEDPHIDAWGDMFQWTESDGSVDDGPNTSEATDLEECIMENLGIFPGDNPPFYNIISIRECAWYSVICLKDDYTANRVSFSQSDCFNVLGSGKHCNRHLHP